MAAEAEASVADTVAERDQGEIAGVQHLGRPGRRRPQHVAAVPGEPADRTAEGGQELDAGAGGLQDDNGHGGLEETALGGLPTHIDPPETSVGGTSPFRNVALGAAGRPSHHPFEQRRSG
jgi:hypothetical protein